MLHRFADIHTHSEGHPNSILSIPADGVERIVLRNQMLPVSNRQCYSIQLHPWHLADTHGIDAFINAVETHRDDPQFVAIGECGLDSLCSTPIDLQRQAFLSALQMARRLHKPVIVHCVRLWAQMIHDVHTVFPELRTQPEAWQQWPVIIHGFRRGPQLARQLLDAGFSLSLGTKYNPDVAKMLPATRRYDETDEE